MRKELDKLIRIFLYGMGQPDLDFANQMRQDNQNETG